jgi:hypothetical protein
MEPNYFWFVQNLCTADPSIFLPGAASRRLDLYFEYLDNRVGKDRTIVDIKYSSTHHFEGYWRDPTEPPALISLLASRGIPVLHIRRPNTLRARISNIIAAENNVWHARSTSELKVRTISLDCASLIQDLDKITTQIEYMTKHIRYGTRNVEIQYDEIFDVDGLLSQDVEEKICDFINVPRFPSRTPAYIKQTSSELKTVIENYAEVAECLAGTPFEWMLNAP